MNKKATTVVFDLDDVLGDFNRPMRKVIAERVGNPAIEHDEDHFSVFEIEQQYPELKCAKDEIFMRMHLDGIIDNLPPKTPFVNLANRLAKDHHLVILTARGWIPNAYDVSKSWLERAGVDFDELIVTPYRGSKLDFFPDSDVILYVDDSHTHIQACAHKARRAWLVDASYNRHLDVPTVGSDISISTTNIRRLMDPTSSNAPYTLNIDNLIQHVTND